MLGAVSSRRSYDDPIATREPILEGPRCGFVEPFRKAGAAEKMEGPPITIRLGRGLTRAPYWLRPVASRRF